jgi:hypothetical protein
MRRWVRLGVVNDFFVEWGGKPVQSIKVGFKRAIVLSGIKGKATPHTLRHTAATWLMQAGAPIWEAAGFLGMSPDMVERTYGHHHPAHSAFQTVLDDGLIKSERRLFATATPRIYQAGLKKAAEEFGVEVVDMNDEKSFGKRFHTLSFGQAIKLGWLTD